MLYSRPIFICPIKKAGACQSIGGPPRGARGRPRAGRPPGGVPVMPGDTAQRRGSSRVRGVAQHFEPATGPQRKSAAPGVSPPAAAAASHSNSARKRKRSEQAKGAPRKPAKLVRSPVKRLQRLGALIGAGQGTSRRKGKGATGKKHLTSPENQQVLVRYTAYQAIKAAGGKPPETNADIARAFDVDDSVPVKIFKRFQQHGTVSRQNGSGRPLSQSLTYFLGLDGTKGWVDIS